MVFSVSSSLITGERPVPAHLPGPAVGEAGSSWYTAKLVERTEDKGHCPLPCAHPPSPPLPCATHQRQNPAERHHAWPDAVTWLQCHLQVLRDKEGLIVPDVKFCRETGRWHCEGGESLRKQVKAVCVSLSRACHSSPSLHFLLQGLTLSHLHLLPSESWKHTSKALSRDFPGSPVVKTPLQASIPAAGTRGTRIPHDPGHSQKKKVLSNPCLCQRRVLKPLLEPRR